MKLVDAIKMPPPGCRHVYQRKPKRKPVYFLNPHTCHVFFLISLPKFRNTKLIVFLHSSYNFFSLFSLPHTCLYFLPFYHPDAKLAGTDLAPVRRRKDLMPLHTLASAAQSVRYGTSVVYIYLQESVQGLLFPFFLLLSYPCINFLMQPVPCKIRSSVNNLTTDMGTFIMRSMAENNPLKRQHYLVRICKTTAITYMDGEGWKSFLSDNGLQRGDEVRLEVIGSIVEATARRYPSNFFCSHHIL